MSLKGEKAWWWCCESRGSIIVAKEALCKFKGAATTGWQFSESIGQECSGELDDTTEIKINRNFNAFTDFESLELKVPYLLFVSLWSAFRHAGTDVRFPVIEGKFYFYTFSSSSYKYHQYLPLSYWKLHQSRWKIRRGCRISTITYLGRKSTRIPGRHHQLSVPLANCRKQYYPASRIWTQIAAQRAPLFYFSANDWGRGKLTRYW
jgi:hypothetical protein